MDYLSLYFIHIYHSISIIPHYKEPIAHLVCMHIVCLYTYYAHLNILNLVIINK